MYIEISEGLHINTKEIQSIEASGDHTTTVTLHHTTVEANLPVTVLLQLIGREDEMRQGEVDRKEKIERGLFNFLKTSEHFAG